MLPAVSLGQTQRLILDALSGSDNARNELLDRLWPRTVLWVASQMSAALRAKVEAEDIAQEILMSVHKSMDSFRGKDDRSFFAWFFRIARNRIADVATYEGAQKRQPVPRMAFSQTSPSTPLVRNEQLDLMLKALESLPDDYRSVIQLVRLEELPVKEVAELLGRTENAVRILYCRALKAMRAAMKGGESGL